ncbi:hypothetical protein CICLE_v10033881mg [Citrus x clementina]|uniref:Uncharacterized protein n=1 Tax=Citrus clementina TaxID=85681 RepID=V4TMM9_CITCL|nr:hypothetical protein CICLE_v10033881mg [Citrus x clementina]
MEDSGAEFPGFQICVHKEEYAFQRPLSRLQKRAPCPLQLIKPNNKASSLECKSASKAMGYNMNSSSSAAAAAKSSSSSFSSFSQNKDPIPLLSPLVLPSMLESSYNIQEGNT